jgi:hypothetical protein
MAKSYIVVRGHYSSGRVAGYLMREERRRFYKQKSEIEWRFKGVLPEDAFQFNSLKMALYRIDTLKAVRKFVRRGGIWEVVRITEPDVLARMDDGPLQQLARVAM